MMGQNVDMPIYLQHRLYVLADRTNGHAYVTVLRLSPSSVCLTLTLCTLAKRCVLEQKLLLTTYRKSYKL